jgi:hypothetical protein
MPFFKLTTIETTKAILVVEAQDMATAILIYNENGPYHFKEISRTGLEDEIIKAEKLDDDDEEANTIA